MLSHSDRRDFLKRTVSAAVGVPALHYHFSQKSHGAGSNWINLFDAQTLAGWHKNRQKIGHGTGGRWQNEDGVFTGEQDPPGSGNGGILLTDQKFGDFEMVIDMKPDWGVCSGLFIRGNEQGQCFQMMVDFHDKGNVGHLYGEGTTGFNTRTFDINGEYDKNKNLIGLTTANHLSAAEVGLIHSCKPAEWLKAWRLHEWNTARVRVTGKYPRITTWINGLKVCEFDGASATTADYDKQAIFSKLGAEGSIALQVHGGDGWPNGAKCRWRNLRVRHL